MKKVMGLGAGALAALALAAIGAIILGVMVVGGLFTSMAGTSGAAGAMMDDESVKRTYFGCAEPGVSSGGGTGVGVGAGVPVSGDQTANVRTMLGIAQTMGMNENAKIAAIMTMYQETRLQNMANDGTSEDPYPRNWPAPGRDFWNQTAALSMKYPHQGVGRNADSVGLFQQRASMGWADDPGFRAATNGEEAVKRLLDPRWSAQQFFGGPGGAANPGVKDIPGWETMEPGILAQKVQGSAHPDAYFQWEEEARRLLAANADAPAIPLVGGAAASAPATGSDAPSEAPATGPAGVHDAVVGAFGECESGATANTGIPVVAGDGSAGAVIDAFRSILGNPYSWGGGTLTGPSEGILYNGIDGRGIIGFDCSSAVRFAIYNGTGGANGGIVLPRTATPQYHFTKGNTVWTAGDPTSNLQPGDLIFYGDPSFAYHVAMYVGNGMMMEAPEPGLNLRETPLRTSDAFAATRIALAQA